MMVSSLLAFNACTKDGAQGPAGPKGEAGAPGAAGPVGPVGPAGAKGADGVTIRSGDAAPAASVGNDGDFFFDKTAKVLYGPKADGAWPATGTTLTGPAGKAGSSFLAGKAAPTAETGKVGDFYFSTDLTTFYGPKAEDGSWETLNKLDLSVRGAKSIYYTIGFGDIKEVANSKVFGQDIIATYPAYGIHSTYKVNSDDVIRIAAYPGWGDNRVMAFESVQGNGNFNQTPTDAADLVDPTRPFAVGNRFVYVNDTNTPKTIFNLSQADVDRLTQNPGNWDYLMNAKVDPATIGLGKDLKFADVKNISLATSTTKYSVNYTAKTSFDLNTIAPGLERIKQDGIVIVKFKNYNVDPALPNATYGNLIDAPAGAGVKLGWTDRTDAITAYVLKGYKYGPNESLTTVAYGTAPTNDIFNIPAVAQVGGTSDKVGAQVATLVAPAADDFKDGKFTYNWTITSGTAGTGSLDLGTGTSSYYKDTHLTATPASIKTGNVLTLKTNDQGQDAAFFSNRGLALVQIILVDAAAVQAAQKAGINLDDANALERFISKR